jgi:competence protein ComEC
VVNRAVPYGPLAVLGAVVVGILAGEAAGGGRATGTLVVGIGGVLVACCLRASPARIGVALVAFALLGGATMQRALHGLDASPLGPAIARHADARLVGTLVDDPDAARFDARALVRVDRFRRRDGGHRRVVVDASGDVAGHLRLLAAGERVVLRGWFTPLEGFDERWRWKHAVGAFHATDVLGVAPTRAALTTLANDARSLVLAGSEHLGPTDRSLLAGFLLGDTRGVPEALTEQFRAAGLTHLTAVSG